MRLEEACEILAVHPDDDESTIKSAYKRLALLNHPDKCKGGVAEKDEATARFAAPAREILLPGAITHVPVV
jgi:curved DNA-binding protein CbpA